MRSARFFNRPFRVLDTEGVSARHGTGGSSTAHRLGTDCQTRVSSSSEQGTLPNALNIATYSNREARSFMYCRKTKSEQIVQSLSASVLSAYPHPRRGNAPLTKFA